MSDEAFVLAGVNQENGVEFCVEKTFSEGLRDEKVSVIREAVENFQLVDQNCSLVLQNGDYQLLQTDPLSVPIEEMAQAIKWQIKDLIDHKPEDVCAEVFVVPPHGLGKKRNKVFVSVTQTAPLLEKIAILEESFLNVNQVTIEELCLGRLVNFAHASETSPIIVVDFKGSFYQVMVWLNQDLYFSREFRAASASNELDPEKTCLELQRSMDFCSSELKLADPKTIIFSSRLASQKGVVSPLEELLGRAVTVMDLGFVFNKERGKQLKPQEQFYAQYVLGAALEQILLTRPQAEEVIADADD